MSIYKKIIPGFAYCFRNNIVKHTANSSFENVYHSVNAVTKNNYCTGNDGNESKQFVRFEDMIEDRRNVAQRSCIVQVNSENSCSELYDYCHTISPVDKIYYYKVKENHFALVEFCNPLAVNSLHFDSNSLAVVSPFVWFRTGKNIKSHISRPTSPQSVIVGMQGVSTHQIVEWMSSSQSLTDEMEVLYQSTKLSELGIKLRMICARQVEMMLSGLFPQIRSVPFGSTVNSFGKEGCDLDIVLRYNKTQENSENVRLVYQSKINGISSRGQIQRQMELVGDMLQIHVPGVSGVKRILGARVPIIKYSHDYAGIEIDISATNLSAVHMSELLYLFANLDPAAQRLVFAIKAWAKMVGLTNPTPGRWITNFSLTLLTIFYLQIERRLPSVDDLFKLAGPDDVRYAEDINCSFISDLTNVNMNLDHSKTPGELLSGFFNFYQNFDFNGKGINLCSAKIISKPDYSPMYIVNPLDRNLNVTKNVSLEEMEKLRIESRNASWALEIGSKLCEIFQRTPEMIISKRKYISRLVAVKDLFQT